MIYDNTYASYHQFIGTLGTSTESLASTVMIPRGYRRIPSFLLLLVLIQVCNSTKIRITKNIRQRIPRRFVSFTLDASQILSLTEDSFWSDPLAMSLARDLSPAYLRIGGTKADFMNFTSSYSLRDRIPRIPDESSINATVLHKIANFSSAVGWDLILGINDVSHRDPRSNAWDPRHFQQFLNYTLQNNIHIAGWELGNEPNLKCVSKQGEVVQCGGRGRKQRLFAAAQLASDYRLLFEVLQQSSSPRGKLFGPDVTSSSLKTFGSEFLGNMSTYTILDAFTWHFYYGPGSHKPHPLVKANFTQPSILDRFLASAHEVVQLYQDNKDVIRKLWVGETSSTYGGGTANLSSSYVAGFLWLDKLGIAANTQQKAVCRQVFAHSYYSVIDNQNRPNPDFWTSLLWKRLIGNTVWEVKDGLHYGRSIRAYAFSASKIEGAITIVLLNTSSRNEMVEFTTDDDPEIKVMSVYLLTSTHAGSSDMYLNSALLEIDQHGKLPPLKGKMVSGWKIQMPPKTYGFAVLKNANVS
mmetsp:Transcript_16778/g.25531  ORF Transcript_16778/g.25531 Transcript_16778/m.25531 type:complete len:525 (-) Transcript_16778:114-1688(-)